MKYSAEAKDLVKQVLEIKSKPLDSHYNCERLDYLENQTRRNNLVIEGIKTKLMRPGLRLRPKSESDSPQSSRHYRDRAFTQEWKFLG